MNLRHTKNGAIFLGHPVQCVSVHWHCWLGDR